MDRSITKTIDIISTYIENDTKLYKMFNHFNQRYKIKDLLRGVFIILTKNIPYRDIDKYIDIKWNMSSFRALQSSVGTRYI